MNKFLLLGFSALLFLGVAEGLMCKVCKYKFANFCWRSAEPCQAEEGQYCETTEVYFGDYFLYSKYGCSKYPELCNTTEKRDNLLRTRRHHRCCNTNLCNG